MGLGTVAWVARDMGQCSCAMDMWQNITRKANAQQLLQCKEKEEEGK